MKQTETDTFPSLLALIDKYFPDEGESSEDEEDEEKKDKLDATKLKGLNPGEVE